MRVLVQRVKRHKQYRQQIDHQIQRPVKKQQSRDRFLRQTSCYCIFWEVYEFQTEARQKTADTLGGFYAKTAYRKNDALGSFSGP